MFVWNSAQVRVDLCAQPGPLSGAWAQQLPLTLWPGQAGFHVVTSVTPFLCNLTSSETRLEFFKRNLGRKLKSKKGLI